MHNKAKAAPSTMHAFSCVVMIVAKCYTVPVNIQVYAKQLTTDVQRARMPYMMFCFMRLTEACLLSASVDVQKSAVIVKHTAFVKTLWMRLQEVPKDQHLLQFLEAGGAAPCKTGCATEIAEDCCLALQT